MNKPTSAIMRATDTYLALAKPRPHIKRPLLEVLRCPYLIDDEMVGFDFSTSFSEQERTDLEVCIPKLLAEVMDMSGSYQREVAAELMVGLHHSGAFAAYPRDEDSAYVLATAILFYIDHFIPNYMIDELAKEHIVALLNEWIQPAEPWRDLPGARTVCRHLFGDAWVALVLPGTCDDVIGGFTNGGRQYTVDDVVRRERPPFQLGICAAYSHLDSVPLPDGVAP
jgi:hypothetical protein